MKPDYDYRVWAWAVTITLCPLGIGGVASGLLLGAPPTIAAVMGAVVPAVALMTVVRYPATPVYRALIWYQKRRTPLEVDK
jgi:uncharacterized membrane protein